jgi:RNA polymerase sigma-70 factor (ECF subfamily)
MTFRDVLRDDLPGALAGEPGAIERLLAAIRPFVVHYCRARIGRVGQSFAAADNLAQQVCMAVLTRLPAFPAGGRPFLAFVYAIAADRADQASQGGVAGARLHGLLSVLPAPQREVVLLRMAVGLTTEETAEATGASPSTVRLTQHRALAKVRRVLGAG